MKQFQIAYKNDESLHRELEEIRQWCRTNLSYTTLFRIYSSDMNLEHIQHVLDILDEAMPDALYLGSTTNANILNGALAKAEIIMTCTVFEYETTQVKLLQIPFSEENIQEDIRSLSGYCNANPWVSSVEVHATRLGTPMKTFCDEMNALRSDIQVFGGGSCNSDSNNMTLAVFSKGNGFLMRGIVFLLLGGEDFHTYSTFISGWKPLTRKFKITKANGMILSELDGEPAFNIYQRFLKIDRNDKLVSNTLEFPLFMDYNGIDVLRCPLEVNDDNSITLTAVVPENTDVRIAYGNPETILSSIRHDGQNIADFQPEAIQVFSCSSRRAFWSDENISDETILFNSVAPTSGFYTGGEFLRINGIMHDFDVTLVFAAMREGEPKNEEPVNIYDVKLDNIENEDKIPLIRRFVSFIEATTAELEESNRKLARSSITDGLTSLYNRTEIEKRIKGALKAQKPGSLSLLMLDIDNFKKVNDTYGHREGDNVILALSEVLRKVLSDVDRAYSGRWGGEEFMVLLAGNDIDEAVRLAEKIRMEFASVSYEKAGCQTVSVGVSQSRDGETADTFCSRVDKALYTAKANGKNRVVRL